MPRNSTQVVSDDWSYLEAILGSFARAWDEGVSPPDLVPYLSELSSSQRHDAAVELIKIDLERRWQNGLRRFVEDYLDDLPELSESLTASLLFEEYQARKLAGDEVSPSEYSARFPLLADELNGLLRVDPALRSTMLFDATTPFSVNLAPGESIDDFDLLLRLGQGSFATVYLARQRSMQRLVAVKVSADKGAEAQTLAQLDHDNIVRVYDQRRVPGRELRLLYMQYASGGTLADVIATLRSIPQEKWSGRAYLKAIDSTLAARGEGFSGESSLRLRLSSMSWPQVVCWLGSKLADALDYAHRLGVLHRDLKPANVLLTSEGVPKLADFNVSFSSKIDGASPAAYFGGSLAYMSPEQLDACNPRSERKAESLDGRSDLFSLGVLLWELLTGDRPFDDEQPRNGWASRLNAMSERRQRGVSSIQLNSIRRDETPGLETVLGRCLAAQADDRFGHGNELARQLELCLQPDARRLLDEVPGGWKSLARRWPVVTVALVTVLPNLVAAVFNFLYNRNEIIERIPTAESTFMRIQMIINLIAFPTGMACAGWLAGSVGRATRGSLLQESIAPQRQRCLDLGNLAAIVGLTLWLVAAPAYPISLHLMLGSVPTAVYVHFVVSLTLCGLIAAAYPFFGVTFIAVRCFYPSLLQGSVPPLQDVPQLYRLLKQTWLYLILAASVPMIAVAILALSGQSRQFALIALALVGTVGFIIAVTAFRIVQNDLAILIRVGEREGG